MNRYVVGFLLAVGLIVLVIVLIVRALVSGPSTPRAADLTSYAGTATSVQYTVDSPVTAADNHNNVIINVGNYQTTITVTQGYEGKVLRTQTYPMSTSAYATFLRSLKFYSFTSGNNDPNAKDERGQCPLGSRYIYQVIDPSGNDVQRYWHTTCGSGTFGGNVAGVRQLFLKQVPDYSKQVAGINL